MINGILDYSKLKHHDILLHKGPVDLGQITRLVLSICQPLLAGKPAKLVNHIDSSIPHLNGDENRILQIMYNLVGNAVKYTDEGTVTVSACLKEVNQTDNMVEITVEDTGVGIPSHRLDHIFISFEQAGLSVKDSLGRPTWSFHYQTPG
ncbi:MAG: HAMP domain-containing sensor histidine kinase [Bacillota bacterium]